MTSTSRTKNNNDHPHRPWVFLGLHLFFASLIIVECSLNAAASADQSTWLAEAVRGFVNWINQSPTTKTITPASFTVTPDAAFSGANALVVGKTKRLLYSLSYSESTNVVYDSTMTYERLSGGTSDYDVFISSSTKGGAFRIVPYQTTSTPWTVRFKSANPALTYDYAFTVSDLLTPTSFTFQKPENLTMKSGDSFSLAPTLTTNETADFGSETADHYLQRFYDPFKIAGTSSDPSLISIDSYGVLRANNTTGSLKSATISYGGESFQVSVSPDSSSLVKPTKATLSLPSSDYYLHPGDFSYWTGKERYGVPLTLETVPADASKAFHYEVDVNSNPLIARVSNAHIDSDGAAVPAGFVQGYDLSGDVTINAISDLDPSVRASVTLNCRSETATSLELTYRLNGTSQGKVTAGNHSSFNVTAGDSFTISSSFLPLNTSDTGLSLSSSDPSVIAVYSNGTSSPSLGFLKKGSGEVTLTSSSNSSLVFSLSFEVAAAPYIPASETGLMSYKIRKIGHFTLYSIAALFMMLFLDTRFTRKGFYPWLYIGTALTEGFLLGCLGELIQMAVPKRTPSWKDIGIDTAGATLGILVIALIFYFVDKKRHKNDYSSGNTSDDTAKSPSNRDVR